MPIEIRGVATIKHLRKKGHSKTKFSAQFSGMTELSTQKNSGQMHPDDPKAISLVETKAFFSLDKTG